MHLARLPDPIPPPERRRERKTENHVFVLWMGQFKYPVGVVLSISEEGSSFVEIFLGVESGLRQLQGEGTWDDLLPKHAL